MDEELKKAMEETEAYWREKKTAVRAKIAVEYDGVAPYDQEELRQTLIWRAEDRLKRLSRVVEDARLDGDRSSEKLADLAMRENKRFLDRLKKEDIDGRGI